MRDQVELGVIAILVGLAFGAVLFVPFIAISHRRRGGLSFWRFVLWGAALVYFWAIWTYTLLPLPDPDSIRCAGVNTDLFAFVDDLRGVYARNGVDLTSPVVLQLLLNVLLFVPLGFFLRVLTGRGIVVALFVGLGLSVFIETTQVTGVWGLYPCAYRVFDVDDMLTNTTGAVLGSLLSLLVPARLRGSKKAADADQPDPVTAGRRLIAMLCDLLTVVIGGLAVGVGTQVVLVYVVGWAPEAADPWSSGVTDYAPLVFTFVYLVITGRTLGHAAVQLNYTGSRLPVPVARVLRYVGGIGGFQLVGYLPGYWSSIAGAAFVVLSVVLVFTTRDRRGLPGIVSGQRLVDSRERAESLLTVTDGVSPGPIRPHLHQ